MNDFWMQQGKFPQYNQFWDNHALHLPAIAREVWCAIFRHTYPDGYARVTRSRIATMIGVSKQHVSNGVAALRDAGLIEFDSERGCYLLQFPSSPSQPQLTPQSTIVDSPSQPQLTPQSTIVDTIQNSLQNLYTEASTEYIYHAPPVADAPKPKQAKLPGTQKMDWQTKAAATRLFDAIKLYPDVPHKGSAKLCLDAWLEAAKEEGGHDLLFHKVCQHIESAKRSKRWKQGYIVPFKKYIEERRYNIPVEQKEIDDDDYSDIGF